MHTAARTAALACLAFPSIVLAQPAAPVVTWDNIDRVIEGAEREGFSGAVLLVRRGEVVLNEGYGLADRAHSTPNTADTIFALGSTPIDFTRVAAIQLIDAGRLDPDDPVTKFFDDIPADKHSMTVRHIRNSASGLPDFPFIRGVDADEDHAELSRDEFIERVRTARLLFEPGTGNEHSHFAWGILAAVVEIVSGQPYEDYINVHVLEPAGMTRTGHNGQRFPGETVAVGYGYKSWGDINSPPHWGPTSWLVKGSGGMVGTTGDMFRFNRALNDGTLLPDSVAHLYPKDGLYSNGDMYGFENWYNYGGENLFYINCNANNPMDRRNGYNLEPLARLLERLVSGRGPARFSIGIAFGVEGIHAGDTIVADRVMPGSPAERAGLRPGDVLVSANGTPFDAEDPLDAIRSGIERGDTLSLVVQRDGQTRTLTLMPTKLEP